MVRATTPTFSLRIKDLQGNPVDLSIASNIYVAIKQGSKTIEFTGDELDYQENIVYVFLTQEKSLELSENELAKIQVNWTYLGTDGRTKLRAATNVGKIMITEQLIKRVIE